MGKAAARGPLRPSALRTGRDAYFGQQRNSKTHALATTSADSFLVGHSRVSRGMRGVLHRPYTIESLTLGSCGRQPAIWVTDSSSSNPAMGMDVKLHT
jgi:hypothetical protein